MSLIELKKHLQQVKIATLSGLCAIFQVEPSCMKTMLEFWIRKGTLRYCSNPSGCKTPCSSCLQCGIQKQEYYEWITN